MTSDISRFINTALAWLDHPEIEGIPLADVFELADSLGQDLADSPDLVDQYMGMEPSTWMRAGGNPFWAVSKRRHNPEIKDSGPAAEWDNVQMQCCLITLKNFSVMVKPTPTEGLVGAPVPHLMDHEISNLLLKHMPLKAGKSIERTLWDLYLRSRFLGVLSTSTPGLKESARTSNEIRIARKKLEVLIKIQDDNVKTFLTDNLSSPLFAPAFKSVSRHFKASFQITLFNSCIDNLQQQEAGSLLKLFDQSLEGGALSSEKLLDMTINRFVDTDQDRVMGQLKVLGYNGLGDATVSRYLSKHADRYRSLINTAQIKMLDAFWFDIALDQMEQDPLVARRSWPAVGFKALSEEESFRNGREEKYDVALSRMKAFLVKSPQCIEAMIEELFSDDKVEQALDIMDFDWPVDDNFRDLMLTKIARRTIEILNTHPAKVVVPKSFPGKKAAFIAQRTVYLKNLHALIDRYEQNEIDPALIFKMGEQQLKAFSDPTYASKNTLPEGSGAYMAHYISYYTDAEDRMRECLKIPFWPIQKKVINQLKLPSVVYRHLGKEHRGEMLGSELGL